MSDDRLKFNVAKKVSWIPKVKNAWQYIKPYLLIFLVVYAVWDMTFRTKTEVVQQELIKEHVENVIIYERVEGKMVEIIRIDSTTNEEINAIIDSGNVDESYDFVSRYLDSRAAQRGNKPD